jgi:hypothetical protein
VKNSKVFVFGILSLLPILTSELYGTVSFVSTYSSTPIYSSQAATVAVAFTSTSSNFMGSTEYTTTATYGALSSGTTLRFFTANTFHVYGPYGGNSSEWSGRSDQSGYAGISLLQNSSGGTVQLISFTPVTDVNYQGTTMVQTGSMDEYRHTITYGPLAAGSSLLLYTANTSNVYGPYSSGDSWGSGVDYGSYTSLTLLNDTSGGNMVVMTQTPLTSVSAVPEPSALSLLAIGLGGLAMMRRRRS